MMPPFLSGELLIANLRQLSAGCKHLPQRRGTHSDVVPTAFFLQDCIRQARRGSHRSEAVIHRTVKDAFDVVGSPPTAVPHESESVETFLGVEEHVRRVREETTPSCLDESRSLVPCRLVEELGAFCMVTHAPKAVADPLDRWGEDVGRRDVAANSLKRPFPPLPHELAKASPAATAKCLERRKVGRVADEDGVGKGGSEGRSCSVVFRDPNAVGGVEGVVFDI